MSWDLSALSSSLRRLALSLAALTLCALVPARGSAQSEDGTGGGIECEMSSFGLCQKAPLGCQTVLQYCKTYPPNSLPQCECKVVFHDCSLEASTDPLLGLPATKTFVLETPPAGGGPACMANPEYTCGGVDLGGALLTPPSGSLAWHIEQGAAENTLEMTLLDLSQLFIPPITTGSGRTIHVLVDTMQSGKAYLDLTTATFAGEIRLLADIEGIGQVPSVMGLEGSVSLVSDGPLGGPGENPGGGGMRVTFTEHFDLECEEIGPGPASMQLPGDCNQDGGLDLSDPVCMLGFLFRGRPARLPCGDGTLTHAANRTLLSANGTGGIDLSDAVWLLSYLYRGTPPHAQGTSCLPIAGCPDNSQRCRS